MRRKTAVFCLLLLGGLVLWSYPRLAWPEGEDGNGLKDPKRLQESLRGKWLQQSRTLNGKQLEDPDGVYFLVTDDGMMQTYSPVESSEGPGPTLVQNVRYRLDEAQDPVTIDTAGRADWTDVSQGICRLEMDSLTLCFAAKNKPRPTMFSTGAGAGMGEEMIIYKRVVKGRK